MKAITFTAEYMPVALNHPEWGKIAILPWDTEIFQFPVGEYKLGEKFPERSYITEFKEILLRWVEKEKVALLCCSILPHESYVAFYLQDIGFHFVDLSIQVVHPRLQNSELPLMESIIVDRANLHDSQEIEYIAFTAFRHGRYHADPLFPDQLANLRYQRWIQNVFREQSEQNQIFVIKMRGKIQGFFHVLVKNNRADLRLGAVVQNDEAGLLGYWLYLGVLYELRKMGIRNVIGRISAANTAVINIYAKLGFHFANPEMVFHWHTPISRLKKAFPDN